MTSYPKAIISLFESANGVYEDWLYRKPGNFLSIQMAKTHVNGGVSHYINKAFWAIPWLVHHLLVLVDDSSVIIWLFNAAWFGWGLQSVLDDRSPSPSNENELGFGQLVPIFLLISTIFVAREVWDGLCLLKCPCVTSEKLNRAHRQDSFEVSRIQFIAVRYPRR